VLRFEVRTASGGRGPPLRVKVYKLPNTRVLWRCVSEMNMKVYLSRKEFERVAGQLEALLEDAVRIDWLYERCSDINSSEMVKWLFREYGAVVEAVLFVPTDAPPDEPPAYLESKVSIDNVIEYIEEKIRENKVVPLCDPHECDYAIFA